MRPASKGSRSRVRREQKTTEVISTGQGAVPLPTAFVGKALALSPDGIGSVASALGVHAAEVWTVLAVETSGCGYINDRRPEILYERHIFSRLTNGKFDDHDISDPTPGAYGPSGAHQYDRLNRAIRNHRNAALCSASWGIGQVLGENFKAAGFSDVETMVAAMLASEDDQLTAMSAFIISNRLHFALRSHDWTTFARGYNGRNFAVNRYDIRLSGEFQKYSSGLLPDLNGRAVQLYLTFLGSHPGPVNGVAGQRTMTALNEFQTARGFDVTDHIDADVVAQILSCL